MSDPTVFYIPRRRLMIADYVATDNPLPVYRDVGVIDDATVTFTRENNEYRSVDLSAGVCREYVADANTTADVGSVVVNLMSNVADNLGLMLSSAVTTVASGAATPETCSTVAVGSVIAPSALPDPASIVLKDSDAGPSTLVLGTDYEFVAQKAGAMRILDLGSYVQPLVIEYDKIDSKTISPMSSLSDRFILFFAGGNERNSCGGEFERFTRARISEDQAREIHAAAATRTALPIPVTFTLDRDSGRNYEFGEFALTEAAAA